MRGSAFGRSINSANAHTIASARSGKACCDEVREIATHHLEQVRSKIADLTQLELLFASTIERCAGGTAPDCAVIDMLEDVATP